MVQNTVPDFDFSFIFLFFTCLFVGRCHCVCAMHEIQLQFVYYDISYWHASCIYTFSNRVFPSLTILKG